MLAASNLHKETLMRYCATCQKLKKPDELRTDPRSSVAYCQPCYHQLPPDERFFPEEWIPLYNEHSLYPTGSRPSNGQQANLALA
jgi:NAD-dependent SIR2 family protein deacetylase